MTDTTVTVHAVYASEACPECPGAIDAEIEIGGEDLVEVLDAEDLLARLVPDCSCGSDTCLYCGWVDGVEPNPRTVIESALTRSEDPTEAIEEIRDSLGHDLCDYQTGEPLRTATYTEVVRSVMEGDSGTIDVDGRTCYVSR